MAGRVFIECPLCHGMVGVPHTVVQSIRQTNQVDVRLSTDGALRDHLTACAAKHGDEVGQTLNHVLGRVTTPAAPSKALQRPEPTTPRFELAGRVDNLLRILEDKGHLTHGERACTMCGTGQDDCLRSLDATERQGRLLSTKRARLAGKPCCPACGNGNTHPTGRESESCAEWGRENGAKS